MELRKARAGVEEVSDSVGMSVVAGQMSARKGVCGGGGVVRATEERLLSDTP